MTIRTRRILRFCLLAVVKRRARWRCDRLTQGSRIIGLLRLRRHSWPLLHDDRFDLTQQAARGGLEAQCKGAGLGSLARGARMPENAHGRRTPRAQRQRAQGQRGRALRGGDAGRASKIESRPPSASGEPAARSPLGAATACTSALPSSFRVRRPRGLLTPRPVARPARAPTPPPPRAFALCIAVPNS